MEKTFDFNVTEQEANLIIQALGEVPAKHSMNLISKLQRQAAEQPKMDQPIEEQI